jgi:hypothetical protein
LWPDAYVELLHRSTFSLCPEGWGAWTHRVTESAICGSIPVANARECAALGLKHRMHAIHVRSGDWESAVDEALSLPVGSVVEIRENLARLVRDSLGPEAAARKLAQLLYPSDAVASESPTVAVIQE